MTDHSNSFAGGCACGSVRISVSGSPKRAGLCHCLTCRKAHGAAFNPFVVFAIGDVKIRGEVRGWESSPGYIRQFCPSCGSRIAQVTADEIEVSLGSFDDVGVVIPQYESWIIRREPWLPPLKVPQYRHDRALE